MANKITYIRAKGYAMVGNTGSPSSTLAPGDRIRFNKNLDSHLFIQGQLAAGEEPETSLLEIVEVDPEVERKQEAERDEALAEAEKIAAQARQEQVARERQLAGEGSFDPSGHNVTDVMEYLRGASPGEVERVQGLESDSDRDSKQIAGFIPKEGSDGEGDTTGGSEGTSPGQDSADGSAGGA